MKETSELLKNTRVSKNLSIEEISAQTKIQLNILKNIEDGNWDALPNKIYIKGFLRQYAKSLGLNEADVISVFDREQGAAEPVKTATPSIPKLDDNQLQEKTNVLWFRAPSKFITLAGISVIVVLITFIYFLSMKIVSYSEETFTKEPEKISADTESPVTSDTPTTSTAETPPTETAATPAKPEDSLSLPKATAPDTSSATAEPAAEDIKPKIVSVDATEAVNIDATWSTGKKENIKLRPNSRHIFYYAKKIKLIISDGGVVQINANEKDLGAPGEAGKPVTLNFE